MREHFDHPLGGFGDFRVQERPVGTLEHEPKGDADLSRGNSLALISVEDRREYKHIASGFADRFEHEAGGLVGSEQDGQVPAHRGIR